MRNFSLDISFKAASLTFAALDGHAPLTAAELPGVPTIRTWTSVKSWRLSFRCEDALSRCLDILIPERVSWSTYGNDALIVQASFALVAAAVVAVGIEQLREICRLDLPAERAATAR